MKDNMCSLDVVLKMLMDDDEYEDLEFPENMKDEIITRLREFILHLQDENTELKVKWNKAKQTSFICKTCPYDPFYEPKGKK